MTQKKAIKIALVHDYLCGVGGSERVFQHICETFPDADIYTLAYREKLTLPYFSKKEIKTSIMNRFISSMNAFRLFFPIATYAMSHIDFKDYDLIISSSASVAKYINKKSAIHICYCYYPTRAIWETNKFFKKLSFKKIIFSFLLSYFKKRDLDASRKVDQFISISKYTKKRVKEIYKRDSVVINSPIDLKRIQEFKSTNTTIAKNTYLVVSRLEKWKGIDTVIKAFNLNKEQLIVVGDGAERDYLQSIANSNILFLGCVTDKKLYSLYLSSKAIVFPTYLEYGLVPIEACAFGKVSICIDSPGVRETMIPYDRNNQFTSIFYDNNDPLRVNEAITKLNDVQPDHDFLSKHAQKYSEEAFCNSLKEFVINYNANKNV